jgi:hypothetical protein
MTRQTPTPASGTGRYRVNRAIFDLVQSPDRRALVGDKAAFLSRYPLEPEERQALEAPDWPMLLKLGALPNLIFKYYLLHGLKLDDLAETLSADSRRAGT